MCPAKWRQKNGTSKRLFLVEAYLLWNRSRNSCGTHFAVFSVPGEGFYSYRSFKQKLVLNKSGVLTLLVLFLISAI